MGRGDGIRFVLSIPMCAKFLTDENPPGLLGLILVSLRQQVGQPLTPGDRMAMSEPKELSGGCHKGHNDSETTRLGEEVTDVKEALYTEGYRRKIK